MRKYINSEEAPKAIGAYHHAVQTGNFVFLSGQLGLDSKSGKMVSDDFSEQAHQVFKNLRAVCRAAGGDLQHLVKINVFLVDMSFPLLFFRLIELVPVVICSLNVTLTLLVF